MVIDSIAKGIVIDHIRAGYGMKVLEYLNIDTGVNTVALIMNAASKKHGRKDVLKIENITDIDLTALGLVDHSATVNIIENHVISRKIKLRLPDKVTNVIMCRNPRCVTSSESGIPHVFHLVDEASEEYRCEYCDDIVRAGAR
ncbi:MAG: aspartate carbamoyltransferase regulatory subunit [Clostridiales Family XIII bacterium]|jgi:aspartate carbamoyltransferase regulatory subunit|nr:aspartate carbamoyltransferase regulatory subunit [Clostridiales Family XIII bacterium]